SSPLSLLQPDVFLALRLLEGRDLLGDELSVVLHPSEQCRAASVLPGQTEEVEAGNVGHASAVAQSAGLVDDGKLDPGVVGPVSGRPDDRVELELAPVLEPHSASIRVDS